MPPWLLVSSAAIVLYVSACLPLALLPYYAGAADSYTVLQELIANLGPLLITAVLLAAAVLMLLGSGRETVPKGRSGAGQLIRQG
jgi:alpha-1,2-mannosyltransferase